MQQGPRFKHKEQAANNSPLYLDHRGDQSETLQAPGTHFVHWELDFEAPV